MIQRIRSHLTYANVMSTLAVFLVIGGGTALASYVVSSNSQVGPNTISGHRPPSGKHANVIAGSINGQDIADNSGVETCKSPLTSKFGPICAGSDGGSRTFPVAAAYCAAHGLRLPSVSEAFALATNYNVPGVSGQNEYFWTDELTYNGGYQVVVVDEDGHGPSDDRGNSHQTVCVADPSA